MLDRPLQSLEDDRAGNTFICAPGTKKEFRRPLELKLTPKNCDRSHTHTYTSKRVSHSHLTPRSPPLF